MCKLIFSRPQKHYENVKGFSMPQRQLTGTRIRERRLDQGMRQADLAKAAGISPSYLNLIEHNRRRIGGRLLNDIARVLSAEPSSLTEGAETALLEQLRLAAARDPDTPAEIARTEEFAGRFPGWGALAVAQARRIEALENRVEALTDRLSHDPQLATSLHEVISMATSIRSISTILMEDEGLDKDWRARFHRNVFDDSARLADSSRALATFLDAPTDGTRAVSSAQEEVEAWFEARGWHVSELEGATGPDAAKDIASAGQFTNPESTTLLTRALAQYRSDALSIPLEDLVSEIGTGDPADLAARFGVGFEIMLRRLAQLPLDQAGEYAQAGLAICDGAGNMSMIKPTTGFALPRGGVACPLWPIFTALGQPGRPMRAQVILPSGPAQHFLCYATASSKSPLGFGSPLVNEAVMLILPISPDALDEALPVGTSCRICPRDSCLARREPSILTSVNF